MNLLREKQKARGWHPACSSAPDMTAENTAAAASAQNGKDALDWYRSVYADAAPQRAEAATRANAVSDAQLTAMNTQTNIANDANQYAKQVYQPLERGIVSDATTFDGEGKRQELAGKALGDVNQQFGAARATEGRQMARLGINPADGAYAAEATQRGNAQALAGAGAATKARSDALTLGHAFKMDAASLGRGLPATQSTAAGLSINAGNASAAAAGLPLSQQQQQAAMMGAGFDLAQRGYVGAGNIFGNINSTTAGVDNANNQAAGAAGSAVAAAVII
jgi:hypothetical protein